MYHNVVKVKEPQKIAELIATITYAISYNVNEFCSDESPHYVTRAAFFSYLCIFYNNISYSFKDEKFKSSICSDKMLSKVLSVYNSYITERGELGVVDIDALDVKYYAFFRSLKTLTCKYGIRGGELFVKAKQVFDTASIAEPSSLKTFLYVVDDFATPETLHRSVINTNGKLHDTTKAFLTAFIKIANKENLRVFFCYKKYYDLRTNIKPAAADIKDLDNNYRIIFATIAGTKCSQKKDKLMQLGVRGDFTQEDIYNCIKDTGWGQWHSTTMANKKLWQALKPKVASDLDCVFDDINFSASMSMCGCFAPRASRAMQAFVGSVKNVCDNN